MYGDGLVAYIHAGWVHPQEARMQWAFTISGELVNPCTSTYSLEGERGQRVYANKQRKLPTFICNTCSFDSFPFPIS